MHNSAISTHSFGPSTMTYLVISNFFDTVHIRPPVVHHLTLTGMPVTTSKPQNYAGRHNVSTKHHVGYSASPHPRSMQHHNELQTAACGLIVLGHLMSLRVIKMTDGQAACKLTLVE